MGGGGRLSIGVRFLLIVLGTVALPLAVTGLWLTRDAGSAGEALLRTRMGEGLAELARETDVRWVRLRSRVLDLADDPAVQALLRGGDGGEPGDRGPVGGPDGIGPGDPGAVDPILLASVHGTLGELLHGAALLDSRGEERVRLAWPPDPERPGLPVAVEVREAGTGRLLGSLRVRLRTEALLGGLGERAAPTGGVIGVLDAATGLPLFAGPFDPELLTLDRFTLAGEEWITERRRLAGLPLTLALASPLEPFALPFHEAARRGILLILAVGVTGFAVAAVLTHRTTRPLLGLADAAESVARGELEARVRVEGPDEVARAARAFNAMAEELEGTLDALGKREALAAVGEFAAALAHELRNPLTALRLDLQRLEEVSGDPERRGALTERLLAASRRLDRTVGGVLRVAGSGRARLRPVPLALPLERATRAARPSFEERGARLELPPEEALPEIHGDEAALEQLLLNLLVNAAEALPRGGSARVAVEVDADEVLIRVDDAGPGMPEETRARALDPLFTTKPGGTGLGLAIANRIARAHGGTLRLQESPMGGVRAEVRLPRKEPAA